VATDLLRNLKKHASDVVGVHYNLKTTADAQKWLNDWRYSFTDSVVDSNPFGHRGIKVMTDIILRFEMHGDVDFKSDRPLKHQIMAFSSSMVSCNYRDEPLTLLKFTLCIFKAI
jgi:hypothetical protein